METNTEAVRRKLTKRLIEIRAQRRLFEDATDYFKRDSWVRGHQEAQESEVLFLQDMLDTHYGVDTAAKEIWDEVYKIVDGYKAANAGRKYPVG